MMLISVVLAYLLGSIPFAYLYGRIFCGQDLRKVGSGNIGATNLYRMAGLGPAVFVYFLDFSKGLVPVLLARRFFGADSPGVILSGLGAIAGHNWTIFLKFRGGKGVATSSGVLCGLLPLYFILALAVFGAVLAMTKIISLSSLTASLAFFILALFRASFSLKIFAGILFILIVIRHIPNIRRMISGTENKIRHHNEKK